MTPEELERIVAREQAARQQFTHTVDVCLGTTCLALHSDRLKTALEQEAIQHPAGTRCQVRGVGCPGLCALGPLVKVRPQGDLYKQVQPQDAPEIIASLNQAPVSRLRCDTQQPFFTRQHKIVLENSGEIDPERLEDYIAAEGYAALLRVLHEFSPQEVIETVVGSGLRGRGGAGFPTGLKWGTVAKALGPRKFVVCNGDEGDPGAFMDRSVMESDPHRVLEGMAIAAYAVGAAEGYLYVRAEYPLAVKRLKQAINQARANGLLGANIGGTGFSFRVEVRLGAGAFVCGEETALLASIEGRRGNPRPRPPFPAESGLWRAPTLINNVETFANIPTILRKGADWFAGLGTAKSKGTKVFALTGKVNNTGLIEVPMGITLREIIYDIGGGPPEGHAFKAVQTGGPSGGCIPAQYLDMAVDYESLNSVGSIMGSGGMIVMDDTSSMVAVAKYFMEFCKSESCGKCVPCRVGTAQMHQLLERLSSGEGRRRDLERLEGLCDLVKSTSLCGLGQNAPNPVISTLRFFRGEYEALLRDGGGAG